MFVLTLRGEMFSKCKQIIFRNVSHPSLVLGFCPKGYWTPMGISDPQTPDFHIRRNCAKALTGIGRRLTFWATLYVKIVID